MLFNIQSTISRMPVISASVNSYGRFRALTSILVAFAAATVLRPETGLGQEAPSAGVSVPADAPKAVTPSRPAMPAPGVFRPFSGGTAGLPSAQAVAPGQTVIVPRSATYLPSSLPLPERLGAGRGYQVGDFALQPVTST